MLARLVGLALLLVFAAAVKIRGAGSIHGLALIRLDGGYLRGHFVFSTTIALAAGASLALAGLAGLALAGLALAAHTFWGRKKKKKN